jgi:cellobiose-specific phosphotransferase system component IIA
MDELKQARIKAAAQQLMDGHDALVDLLPAKKTKKTSEEAAILEDALDSLEEAISCLSELLDEEA